MGHSNPLQRAARSARRSSSWTPLLVASSLALSGCDARLEQPDRLWLLWLVPALGGYFIWAWRRRSQLLARFAAPELLVKLGGNEGVGIRLLKMVCLLAATGLLLFSLAGLMVGFEWEEVQRRGVDIVIALDTSDSMLVRDVDTSGELSRMERAKREIQDLLTQIEGDRVALVAFAGTSFLELPLTLDYSAAQMFLSAIDTEIIPVKGTSLGNAIRTAVQAFESSSSESRALILITDGEDHDGDAIAAAELAKEANVRIFPIGIGRDEGAPIPRPSGGFRRDQSGEIILSRLDEPTLQRLALETGGRYVRSVTGDMDLEQIYQQGIKASLEDTDLESGRRQRWRSRFQWLILAAVILLMVESVIDPRLRRTSKS